MSRNTSKILVLVSALAIGYAGCTKRCPFGTRLNASNTCESVAASPIGAAAGTQAAPSSSPSENTGAAGSGGPVSSTALPNTAASAAGVGAAAPVAAPSVAAQMMAMVPSCTTVDEIRCGNSSPQARERCVNGMWSPYAPCSASKVCAGPDASKPGECLELAEVCQGKQGMKTCDGSGTMYECGQDAEIVGSPLDCDSIELCMAGLATGVCATCLPGAHMCSRESLLVCLDGSGFDEVELCASEKLCNADQGACDPPACEADTNTCMGGDLYRCNRTLTEYERQMSCPSGCNADRGECNECDPSSAARCDGDSIVSCRSDGSGEQTMRCPKACNDGKCVDCNDSSECSSTNPCRPGQCDSSGRCTSGLAPRKTSCGGDRICDALGNCVECVDDSDCGDPQSGCQLGRCQRRPGLEQFSGSSGSYRVRLNPGYSLSASSTFGGDGENPVRISAGSDSVTLDNSRRSHTFSATNAVRTVTISANQKEPGMCDGKNQLSGSSQLTIHFEDQPGGPADCDEPVLTLRAQ